MHKSFDCWQRGEEFLFDIKLIRGGSNVNNLHVGSGLYLFSIVIGRLFNNVRGCEGELV